jgi:putative transposase
MPGDRRGRRYSIGSCDRVLTQLVSVHGAPQFLRSDNGPEFVATAILRWLQIAQIETAFIDPGKPWQNGADESFNGTFRDQHLSLPWFRNRTDAKVSIEAWRRHYNDVRPHSSLGYLTPAAFKAKHLAAVDRGRSPALPARADMTTNEEPLTSPISAVLQ